MSINCDPDLYEYSVAPNVCPLCFEADKTAATLFFCVTGIEMGTGVPGVDPDPPNGIWEVAIFGPCRWLQTIGPYTFELQSGPDAAQIVIDVAGAEAAFVSGDPNPCQNWYHNDWIDPAGHDYVGGYVLCIPYLPGGDFSIDDLQELINIHEDDPLYCNPRPMTGDSTVYQFMQRNPPTNIKIKFTPL